MSKFKVGDRVIGLGEYKATVACVADGTIGSSDIIRVRYDDPKPIYGEYYVEGNLRHLTFSEQIEEKEAEIKKLKQEILLLKSPHKVGDEVVLKLAEYVGYIKEISDNNVYTVETTVGLHMIKEYD